MTLLLSALQKLWFGLYRRAVHRALHCCLLSSVCSNPIPPSSMTHAALWCCQLLSALVSLLECTTQEVRVPAAYRSHWHFICWLASGLCHFLSTHPEPIKQHYLQTAGTRLPFTAQLWCSTLHHAAGQHWPHWFCWNTLLPSVRLPHTWLLLSASGKVGQKLLLDSLKDSWDE